MMRVEIWHWLTQFLFGLLGFAIALGLVWVLDRYWFHVR
jgi:hypothetical protein